MINEHPTHCNICNGRVVLVSNAKVYNGKRFGNGWCYLCVLCGAYVGTHKNDKDRALGILSTKNMRTWKIRCHELFDTMWTTTKERNNAYKWLANELGIEQADCHFGHMSLPMLRKAYQIIKEETNATKC